VLSPIMLDSPPEFAVVWMSNRDGLDVVLVLPWNAVFAHRRTYSDIDSDTDS
jgi:hypothetical protein